MVTSDRTRWFALVLGITQGRQWDWLSGKTTAVAAAALLLAAFALWERRQHEPLVRFSIFRLQTLTGANVAMFIMGTAYVALLLMLTLYMQQVLGYSPPRTGSPTSRSPARPRSGRMSWHLL
jgi:predicted small integral membrane protein